MNQGNTYPVYKAGGGPVLFWLELIPTTGTEAEYIIRLERDGREVGRLTGLVGGEWYISGFQGASGQYAKYWLAARALCRTIEGPGHGPPHGS